MKILFCCVIPVFLPRIRKYGYCTSFCLSVAISLSLIHWISCCQYIRSSKFMLISSYILLCEVII
jgi:hypothetical protein